MKKELIITVLPDAMKALPYCCWKREKDSQGRDTKVPYNPKSGYRAKVDVPATFGTLEEALEAYGSGRYAGIGFNVSVDGREDDADQIGGFDLDDCVTDGMISEAARDVLEILPGAYAEFSPSGTGIHGYFRMPEGFVFDRDEYYINNRKNGMEIYLPGVTKHFLTLTGDVFRAGNMTVTAEQLQLFLNRYMARPEKTAAAVTPPEGGSVLSDGEVIRKLSGEPNGERFMRLYRGEWEACAPEDGVNWSHSEADMCLCMKLAFYCRGDLEQMDRLFRESGLMREKWDRQTGGSTYGEITMTNAVQYCSAFYEPPGKSSAAEDFAGTEDYAEQVDRLLAGKITPEVILSEDALRLAAWAYGNDMLRYTRIRQAVPKEVGVRNFEKAMRRQLSSESGSQPAIGKDKLLSLSGVVAPGMIVPGNWIVDEHGVRYIDDEGCTVTVAAEPLFVSARMENVDDGSEKLELTYRRNGRYRKLIAPRSDLLNRNSIIQYADDGLPVSSGTAGNLTRFIAEMEAANGRAIPINRCVRRAGWVSDEFFPYLLNSPMLPLEDEENAERFLKHLHENGSADKWFAMAAKVRAMPFARAMLAASFASPLLYPLQHRNIYYHNWCDTRSGKTAALKFAMSVWGDPASLVKSYFATMVGMEHRAGTMKHLPLALDELQTIDRRLSINNMVYTLGNGVGKTRGRAGGGIRAIDDWRNCILSTGEQPISTDSSMDGINTRLLEIYGKPVEDETMAAEMHQVCEQHYGFAATPYIRYLVGHMEELKADFDGLRSELELLCGDENVKADNIAVLALADYYSSVPVFGMEKDAARKEALELGQTVMAALKQEDHTDTVDRAWNFVSGWAACNKDKFVTDTIEPSETYGMIEKGKIYVICAELNKALEEAGYSYRKCIRGFSERGYLKTTTDSNGKNRNQLLKRVKGISTRVYVLNLEVSNTEPADDGFLR